MTVQEIREAAKIMEAYANGKKIQCNDNHLGNGEWVTTDNPSFNWDKCAYRIKPEPKYRPFKSQEECWQEMHKHPDFGWIKGKVTGEYKQVIRVFGCKTELIFNISYNSPADYSPEMMFSSYTFTDGTPFGIKNEE